MNPAKFAAHSVRIAGSAADVEGKVGTDASGLLKLKAFVMSPTVARRHADKLGTSAPNRVSMKRSIEV